MKTPPFALNVVALVGRSFHPMVAYLSRMVYGECVALVYLELGDD